jgi:PEP-CTERM motif
MTGIQKMFTTMAVSAVVVVLLFSTPTVARAQTTTNMTAGGQISLATVINNNLDVQVGDKLFGNFSFSYNDTSGGTQVPVTESNVTLSTISNVIGFGLQFSQPLLAIGPIVKDIVFQYSAQVVQPSSSLISDIHLTITGSDGNGGLGTVGETASVGGFGATTVGTLQASLPVASNDVAAANITPVTKVWITKDVIVTGGSNPSGFASISVIDQSFSQIPEPGTVLLVGLGLLGVVAVKRKS